MQSLKPRATGRPALFFFLKDLHWARIFRGRKKLSVCSYLKSIIVLGNLYDVKWVTKSHGHLISNGGDPTEKTKKLQSLLSQPLWISIRKL